MQKITSGSLIIKIKRLGYEVIGVLKNESEMDGIKMMDFEVTESSANSPYAIGDTISISKNETRYHYTYYKK